MKSKINLRLPMLILMILFAGMWRLFVSSGHTSLGNFTPIGAMGLFGGFYFSDKWKAILIPLLTLWLTDLFLNYFVYYGYWKWFYVGFYYTYGSFILTVFIGRFMTKATVKNILFAGVSAALLHWIITDFGVWLDGRMYPKNIQGLITCYVMAIPYLKNMIISNLLFSAVLFGLFEFAQHKFVFLMPKHIKKS
jgi:hypothetical protein